MISAQIDELRERITTQKQTIQAYRDESREWREVAERAQAENEKLRELCEDMLSCIEIRAAWHRPPTEEMYEEFAQRARELGIEEDG